MRRKQIVSLSLLAVAFIFISAAILSYTDKLDYVEALYRVFYVSLSHHDSFYSKSWTARIINLVAILAGLALIAYLIKLLSEYIINLGDGLKKRKIKARIIKMKDHYIVCGYGRVGSQVARELAIEHQPFVVIEKDENKVREAVSLGYIAFVGDPTKEKFLHRAKIEKAKGMVASLGEDSANLYVTLTARQLNPDIFIVSRANREESVNRILRAGADKVTMPNQIGGLHMATSLIRPHVTDFLEVLSVNKYSDLQIQEVNIPKGSKASGHQIGSLTKHIGGLTILALNTRGGQSQVHPDNKEVLYPGDNLVVMGTKDQIKSLHKIL